jgi:glyoxylase-like metal-dependent hydrolase (beta-lactamase superfamily II)
MLLRSPLLLAMALAGLSACGAPTPKPLGTSAAAAAAPARWCDLLPRPSFQALERVPVREDWFEVYRVDPGVFAIYEPFQFQEVISYLIIGRERALLFDTGLGIGRISAVTRELTPLPVTVLNSHTHYDHVGGNAEFQRILALDTPYTRANIRGFPHAAVAGEVAASSLCRPLPAGVDSASFRTRPYTPTEWIADGHRIDLGGRTLEVIAVPGHTPDAVALLDRAAGLLWMGDTYYEGPIWLYVPETDLNAYQRSIDRLVPLVPSLRKLLSAHNQAVADPHRLLAVQAAIAQVRAGTVQGTDKGNNQLEFLFGGFSILTSRPLLAGRQGSRTNGGSGLTTWP